MGTHHLYLIDGSGYIFRAYYAVRPLSNSHGLPTNAIYGFTQMLIRLMKEAKPEHWAIIFDTHKPTFREEIYDQYKANRKEPPDDLVPQFPYFPKVVAAMNIPMFSREGYEADDIIATLTRKAKAAGYRVTIISGDKDLMQLVDGTTTMWDTMKDKKYDPAGVVEKFGVSPEKIVDLFSLMGDASDNIPGVPGIGPKTAAKLIQDFGSLDTLLRQTDKLKGKQRENIEANVDKAKLSRKLATLDDAMDLKFDEEGLRFRTIDTEACIRLFKELEFVRLLSDLQPQHRMRHDYQLVTNRPCLENLAAKIKAERPMLAVDLETDSLDVMRANIVGFAIGWGKGEAAYIPVGHFGLQIAEQLTLAEAGEILKPLLADPGIPKVGQNIKYDLAILKRHGFEVKHIVCDTMIASYLINPGGPHNLDHLSAEHLNHKTIQFEEVVGKKGPKQKSFSEVPLDRACAYAAEDADCTWQLADLFMPRLKQEGLDKLFTGLEMPLMEVLLKMEMAGVKVDAGLLRKLSDEFAEELFHLEKKIFTEAGEEFNINSPKQLGEILFHKLHLPGVKKTKTGWSTSQEVLEELAQTHDLPKYLLQYRSLGKLKSTYTDSLLDLVNKETGRIHTSFNQTVAATGRLSSSDPNLQNIPIRSPDGKRIRGAFIAEPGNLLLSADYSQIELRILAHFTEDPSLLEAFEKGIDIHTQTAAALFQTTPEKVTPVQRSAGKTVNFSVLYGQSAYGLSQLLKIPPAEAGLYIENYFRQFPQVKCFREAALEKARHDGCVATLCGRRRFTPDLKNRNFNIRANAERMAFNTIFQGSAADIIKKAMIQIDAGLPPISAGTKMLIQVHDELVFETPEKDLDPVREFVRSQMEGAARLKVPLKVDCGFGRNWAEAH